MAAAVFVGVVLLVAGAAKLRQPAWPATARAFGAPRWIATVLPWTEVAVGALLVTGVGRPWTAMVAAGLVASFTTLIALRLALGQPAPCGCFGETSTTPVGVDTLVRNVVLLVAAMVAVVAGDRGGGVVAGAVGVAAAGLFLLAARSRVGVAR